MPIDVNGYKITSDMANPFRYKDINTNGLVWYMDASALESYPQTGNKWFDMSGTNTSATLQSSPSYNSANSGSLVLNGSSQYIEVGSFMSYSKFSIALWVYPGATQITYADIFDNNHTGTQNFVCQQNVDNVNQYEFAMIGSSSSSGTGLFTLTANTWVFLVFTFDGSVVRGYKDTTLIGTGGSMTPNYVSPYFRLGCWAGFGSVGRFWNGRYGNCMIYNRNLLATEITKIYNVQKQRFGF
jgi:hypothetical protein